MNSDGRVATTKGEILLRIPTELRKVDDSLVCVPTERSGRQTIIEFSKFASWEVLDVGSFRVTVLSCVFTRMSCEFLGDFSAKHASAGCPRRTDATRWSPGKGQDNRATEHGSWFMYA